MYIHRLSATNFRAFGGVGEATRLNLVFNRGLNILVGENDAGKTSIVDALRYVLLTTSNDFLRIDDDDFNIAGSTQAEELEIEVELRGLNTPQQAALLEWLTLEAGNEPFLIVNLRARRRCELAGGKLLQPIVRVHAGASGSGPEVGAAVRELIRTTYLKPLRDALSELRPKKASRLSQVLRAHKDVKKEATNNFNPNSPDDPPTTLVEVMAQAQHRISKRPVITDVRDNLNKNYLTPLISARTTKDFSRGGGNCHLAVPKCSR